MEPFNKYREDLSYDNTESHFEYELDSTPVVTNKRKFDKIGGTSNGDRNISRQDLFMGTGTDEGERRTENKEEASNDVKKREEGLGETVPLAHEHKHSLSNDNLQLCTSDIESCSQQATLLGTLGTVEGVMNKNWLKGLVC